MKIRAKSLALFLSGAMCFACCPMTADADSSDEMQAFLVVQTDKEQQLSAGDMTSTSARMTESGTYTVSVQMGAGALQLYQLAVCVQAEDTMEIDALSVDAVTIRRVAAGQTDTISLVDEPSAEAQVTTTEGTYVYLWQSQEDPIIQDLAGDNDPTTAEYDFSDAMCLEKGDTLAVTFTIDFGVDTTQQETDSTDTDTDTDSSDAADSGDSDRDTAETGLRGDANLDETVDILDAALTLQEYANLAAGGSRTFQDLQFSNADVDEDESITILDASAILCYYAVGAAGGSPSWEEILG